MTERDLVTHRSGSSCDKIIRRHRERLAIVYIRQSTAQQVERHQESTRLQYALVDRAFQFGWARETIVVIDDDLGRSGATIEGRLGFQRLVAEVGLGNVGLVLGVEMSRLARSCRDWHQLLEICALFDTLIADADGVYDPANYNDRLLLGSEGNDVGSGTAHPQGADAGGPQSQGPAGRTRQAGADGLRAPSLGRSRLRSRRAGAGDDPPGVRSVRTLPDGRQGDELPRRARHQACRCACAGDAGKGELEWRRVSRPSLENLFANPIYAGVYALRRACDRPAPSEARPSGHRTTIRRAPRRPRSSCPIGCRPTSAGSSYERNQAQLRANWRRASGTGAGRQRAALGPADLRPLRSAHDGALQQQRPCGPLRLLARCRAATARRSANR